MTQGVSRALWFKDATETVDVFRREILKEIVSRFKGMQISLLWTILLDPRLTEAMNGFSADERLEAKKMLINQMRSAPTHQNEKQTGGDDASTGSL